MDHLGSCVSSFVAGAATHITRIAAAVSGRAMAAELPETLSKLSEVRKQQTASLQHLERLTQQRPGEADGDGGPHGS